MEHEKDIAQALKALQEVQLSAAEKARVRSELAALTSMKQYTPQRTYVFTYLARPLPMFAAALIIFLSGGTSIAANGALPGDTLYPIKVRVNEELRGVLTVSPQNKAQWAIERAERRIDEAAHLALKDALPASTRERLNAQAAVHTARAAALLAAAETDTGTTDIYEELRGQVAALTFVRERLAMADGPVHAAEPAVAQVRLERAQAMPAARTNGTDIRVADSAVPAQESASPRELSMLESTDTTGSGAQASAPAQAAPMADVAAAPQRKDPPALLIASSSPALTRGIHTALVRRIGATERLLTRSGEHTSGQEAQAAAEVLSRARAARLDGEALLSSGEHEAAHEHFSEALSLITDAHALLTHPRSQQ